MDINFTITQDVGRTLGEGRYWWPTGSDELTELERDAVVGEVVEEFAAQAARHDLSEVAGTRRTEREFRGEDAPERDQTEYQLQVEGKQVRVVAEFTSAT